MRDKLPRLKIVLKHALTSNFEHKAWDNYKSTDEFCAVLFREKKIKCILRSFDKTEIHNSKLSVRQPRLWNFPRVKQILEAYFSVPRNYPIPKSRSTNANLDRNKFYHPLSSSILRNLFYLKKVITEHFPSKTNFEGCWKRADGKTVLRSKWGLFLQTMTESDFRV